MEPKIKFYPVKRVVENNIPYNLPERKTKGSAGYDIEIIEDTYIPSKSKLLCALNQKADSYKKEYTLEEVKELTEGLRPTIVRTGLKAEFPEDYVCILVLRSSIGLKCGLTMPHGFGTLDSDFFSNQDNDGEIGFIVENNLPIDIKLKKGDIIGQALFIKRENISDEKIVENIRTGGYGSTS